MPKSQLIFDNSHPIDSIAPRVLELHQTFLDQALSTKLIKTA